MVSSLCVHPPRLDQPLQGLRAGPVEDDVRHAGVEFAHTYFRVGHIEKARLQGLNAVPYLDKTDSNRRKTQQGPIVIVSETDRVYLNTTGAKENSFDLRAEVGGHGASRRPALRRLAADRGRLGPVQPSSQAIIVPGRHGPDLGPLPPPGRWLSSPCATVAGSRAW